MVESTNPFAGELPPASVEFTDLGVENAARTEPEIVGDNATLKIAVEGQTASGMQPLNIDQNGSHVPEPSGTWVQAAFHSITAVVGAGILGLPYAFSYLGFWGGSIMLTLAAGSAMYTASLLASMHEMNGTRHNRYRDLGTAILGKKYSNIFIAPFQFSVMIGLAVAYTVTGGKSLQVIEEISKGCNFVQTEIDTADQDCDVNLTKYIFVFALFQILLSQIPSFHHLWWVSIVGAVTALGYSMLAGILAIVASQSEDFTPSYEPRDSGWPLWRGILNALGGITFAYGGHSVLLEIQATLKTPPSARDSMMKGITLANAFCASCYFFVAISGYASYGNIVADDVLASQPRPAKGWVGVANFLVWLHVLASFQVFSHPIFESVETALSWRLQKFPPLLIRVVWRTGYVLWITIIAASFPFFGEIVGLIGSVGFIPMTFIMPHVLWLTYKKDLGASRFINYTLMGLFTFIAFFALIGSIASIAHKSSEFEYWT